jgi:hypothetical protein
VAPQHEVASRTHRSTINWIFTMFSFIIDYWIANGIYSAFIMIIINLIIDKSRLCYKITIKYWQILYRILNYTRIKPRSRTPQKKSACFTHPEFSAAKIEKKVRKLHEQTRHFLKIHFNITLTSAPRYDNHKIQIKHIKDKIHRRLF